MMMMMYVIAISDLRSFAISILTSAIDDLLLVALRCRSRRSSCTATFRNNDVSSLPPHHCIISRASRLPPHFQAVLPGGRCAGCSGAVAISTWINSGSVALGDTSRPSMDENPKYRLRCTQVPGKWRSIGARMWESG